MQTISATYRVTTPMFLGGVPSPEQEEDERLKLSADHPAEFRLPSFKGVLRFWWRALAWDRIKDASRLRDEEAALFGSSNERVGQSKVLLRVKPVTATVLAPNHVSHTQLKDGGQVVGLGARYLGYGVMEAFDRTIKDRNKNPIRQVKGGQLTRSCVSAPFTFTVNLLLKPSLKQEQAQEIERTLKVLGLLGSLGSKSRKGYGSLTLLSLKLDDKETWTAPTIAEKVTDAIRTILGPTQVRASQSHDVSQSQNGLPEWTAFSLASRIIVVSADNRDRSPLAILDKIGREMVRYRSWGRNGKVLGNVDSEQNFEDDHDLMKQDWKQRQSHPHRIVFGLPHNYGQPTTEHVEPAENHDRRASPLFIHIHQPNDTTLPVAVLSFLPACFLPADAGGISVGKRERDKRGSGDWEKQTVQLASDGLWNPINAFLDRMLDPNERKETFGAVTEVTHG
jgi:CRISPR-associated protein Cmr1